jgi:hypothetical protein
MPETQIDQTATEATEPNPATDYTPMEYLALVASRIVAQSTIVANTVASGKEHPLGVYSNEYGRVIAPGKPQRKQLVGMILVADLVQELSLAFIAARESPDGVALLVKTQAAEASRAGQNGERPC